MTSVYDRLSARGWSDQLIVMAKVVGSVMVIGGFILGGLSLFSVTVAIPTRVSALETNIETVQANQETFGLYVRFLVLTECARLAPDVKVAIRNTGVVDCDNPVLRLTQQAPAVKIPP
jgi:cytochrome bd-type quinol oxidase subunit 1